MSPGAWPIEPESALVCVGAVLEWALALYVLTRGGWRRIPVLAALAIAALVVYQLGIALAVLSPPGDGASRWLRATWPGPALLPALWLTLTAALAAEEGPEARRSRLRPAYYTAAALSLGLGLFFAANALTDLVRRWGPWESGGQVYTSTPGPLYPAYFGYVLVCALWGLGNAVLLWRTAPPGTPLRARWRWLLATALLFLASGTYLGMASTDLALSGIPGDALLIVGMLVMGWSIARYGALVAGEVVGGDFAAFAASMAAVVLFYGAALVVFLPRDASWLERALPLLLLLMATHVLAPRQSLWLERLIYGHVRGTLRDQLRLLAARVVRQPDPISALVEVRESVADLLRANPAAIRIDADGAAPARPAPTHQQEPPGGAAEGGEPQDAADLSELRLLAEGALRRLNDLPSLSQHPLLGLLVPPVGESSAPTALERARQVREALVQAIARVRPPGARPNPGAHGGAGGWLHFLVLHEAYVEGRPNKEIMQRYYLSEGTFHRARRRAVDALALDLHQRQLAGVPATI